MNTLFNPVRNTKIDLDKDRPLESTARRDSLNNIRGWQFSAEEVRHADIRLTWVGMAEVRSANLLRRARLAPKRSASVRFALETQFLIR